MQPRHLWTRRHTPAHSRHIKAVVKEKRMMAHMCSIDGCSAPVKRKGYCYGHYMKDWRYGTPTPQHVSRRTDLVGRRFGLLVVVEHKERNLWMCQCDCGNTTQARTGDLNRGSAYTCGDLKHRLRDDAEYGAAHERVKALKGSASQYPCVDCGQPARHWSYNHDDPHALTSAKGRTIGQPYSLNPHHYRPRCVPCHKTFDLDQLALVG